MNRRSFLKRSSAVSAAAVLPGAIGAGRASAQTTTPPVRLSGAAYTAKFTKPLLRPPRINLTGMITTAAIQMEQFSQQVLEGYPKTKLYGYGNLLGNPSWPGPTIEAMKDRKTRVLWTNRLPAGRGTVADAHMLRVDKSIAMAMPTRALPTGNIPTVPHLHGSHVEWESDGHPEGWFTQNTLQRGDRWRKLLYEYENTQRAGTLWYHDHAIGITRLNVYAGLAGTYLLRDSKERQLVKNRVLPDDQHEVELILQDRFFTDDGQLDLPVAANPANGVSASVFGDFICVNGRPWPYLDVEPRKYRFRFVNGSDSRFYNLELNDPNASFLFVGTELGLMRKAVQRKRVTIGPGERYDVVVDFSAFANKEITMTNAGPGGVFVGFRNAASVTTNNPNDTPFGFGAGVNANSTALVMRFRVGRKRSGLPNASVQAGTILGAPMEDLIATKTRAVMAYQGRDDLGRATEFLGSLEHGTAEWHEKPTEVVKTGDTEVWEFYNLSPVAHPVHIHLVDFQVIGRQTISPFTIEPISHVMCNGQPATGGRLTSGAEPIGVERPAEEYERGPKDTVIAYPNEVTRVVARFDKPGEYIWHCHIIHHEDHSMMRPLIVGNGDEDDPALQAQADRRLKLYCGLTPETPAV
ncbi:MAG: spore coat protein manganese oxidase [Solirubrobacteraceae bacterium]|nr:spore coat protein manganese oxidase [Solirubrobacteraceae bacterium]